MKSVDLHIHSCYSDGIYTPEQIVATAKKKGIKCISITDHDSIAAQYIVNTEYNNKELTIIPGIELSTEYKEMEFAEQQREQKRRSHFFETVLDAEQNYDEIVHRVH